MMLAIKEASADLSPYVRKTAAHAIQKLYRYSSVHRLFILLVTDYKAATAPQIIPKFAKLFIKADAQTGIKRVTVNPEVV